MTTTLAEPMEAPTAPVDGPLAAPGERLGTLVERAKRSVGDARRVAAGELNALMALLARSPSRPVADALLKCLDDKGLTSLLDTDGLTSRAAAASALLAMGYPYALEISPEDLDHLRERSPKSQPLGRTLAAALIVGVTAGLGALDVFAGTSWDLTEVAALCLQVLAMAAAALMPPRSVGRRAALFGVLVGGFVTLSLSASNLALVVPGVGGVAAFAIAWPRRRP